MARYPKYILSEMSHIISSGIFNHCSSLLSSGESLYVAYYSGTHECEQDQRVNILNLTTGLNIELEGGTGNPVLFKDAHGRDFILYSEFVKHKNITRNVDKWKYCNINIREILGDHVSLSHQLFDECEHLLGRCTPIVHDGHTYLPLYNELDGFCVICRGNGDSYKKWFWFGEDEIQPALYYFDGFKALTRNFNSPRTMARIHHVSNETSSFDTLIPNNNNSIAVARVGDIVFVVYNDSDSYVRKNLSLGFIENDIFKPIKMLDSYGHYPSIIKHKNKLVISYTTYYSTIKVAQFELDSFLNECAYCLHLRR